MANPKNYDQAAECGGNLYKGTGTGDAEGAVGAQVNTENAAKDAARAQADALAKIAAAHSCPADPEKGCKHKSEPEITVLDPQLTVSEKRKGAVDIHFTFAGIPIDIHFTYEFWYAKAEAEFEVVFDCH